jgi:hypothetical protein
MMSAPGLSVVRGLTGGCDASYPLNLPGNHRSPSQGRCHDIDLYSKETRPLHLQLPDGHDDTWRGVQSRGGKVRSGSAHLFLEVPDCAAPPLKLRSFPSTTSFIIPREADRWWPATVAPASKSWMKPRPATANRQPRSFFRFFRGLIYAWFPAHLASWMEALNHARFGGLV